VRKHKKGANVWYTLPPLIDIGSAVMLTVPLTFYPTTIGAQVTCRGEFLSSELSDGPRHGNSAFMHPENQPIGVVSRAWAALLQYLEMESEPSLLKTS
jgi:hypothetical protein